MDQGARDLIDLGTMAMPFGKYAGRKLVDLPEPYVLWMNQKGSLNGRLGRLFAILYEVKLNGLDGLVREAASRARGIDL